MSDITLGIIGSGQLGSLLCQAAKKLDVKTMIFLNNSFPLKYSVYENKLIKYYARNLKINRKNYGNITNTYSFRRY